MLTLQSIGADDTKSNRGFYTHGGGCYYDVTVTLWKKNEGPSLNSIMKVHLRSSVPCPMLCKRMLDKKRRSLREASIIHLVAIVILVSLTIYLWQWMTSPWNFSKWLTCSNSDRNCVLILSNTTSGRLEGDDFGRLINLSNFTFTIGNSLLCNDSDPILLTMVHSHPNHLVKRSTIRKTWGSLISNRFKLVFLVGIPRSKLLQSSLEEENELYGDLIQGNFIDDYRNMTYKHVMGLKWVSYFCPKSKYILKTDDDVFVNSPAVLDYISTKLLPYSVRNLLLCSPIFNGRVQRSSRSKWKVTFLEYSFPMYPTYCEGFAILYSPDVVYTLYLEAQGAMYFWIDDVHVTGLLAAKANLKHTSFGTSMLSNDKLGDFLRDEGGKYSYLVGPYNLRMSQIVKLWEKVSNPNRNSNSTKS